MKKLLSVLAAVGLTATASSAVVACGSSEKAVSDSFTLQTTEQSVWGFDGTEGPKGLEQLFEQTSDSTIKDVAKYVAKTLGIKDTDKKDGWHFTGDDLKNYTSNTKIVEDEWKSGALKDVKDGQEVTNAELQKILATKGKFADDAAFQAEAKKGGEFDILVQQTQKKDAKATDKTKIMVLHITFKAPAKAAAK